jgi:feruloyl esterase
MHQCLGEKFDTNPTKDFDAVALLKQWKATGRITDRIVVTQTNSQGRSTRRVVCAYPRLAQYRGKGDPGEASNFVCRQP